MGNSRVACRCVEKPTATTTTDATYLPAETLTEHYEPWGASIAADILPVPLPTLPNALPSINTPQNRFTYNGKELQTDIGLFEYGFRWYDPMNARFTSVDPLAEKKHNLPLTPYHYTNNNPIKNIDLDGRDWYRNDEGNVQWFDNNSQSFSTGNKKSHTTWSNAGTEFLKFDGKSLTYSWQNTDKDGKRSVSSVSFHAVSGRPQENKDGSNSFTYTNTRQQDKGKGGLPEGLYSINKSGLQLWSDVSLANKLVSTTGLRGAWKGGQYAWGRHRYWITPEDGTNTYGRSNFSIHGGESWGSAGCIDLGTCGARDFSRTIMGRLGERVILQVEYSTEELKLQSLDTETWKPKE